MFHSWKVAFNLAWRLALKQPSSFATQILRISAITLAVSLAVMLSTLALVNGFQSIISQRLFQIWGNYRVLPIGGSNESMNEYFGNPRQKEFEEKIHAFAPSSGISCEAFSSLFIVSQTPMGVDGMMLKSFEKKERWKNFWVEELTEKTETAPYNVFVSTSYAKQHKLKLGDEIFIHTNPNRSESTILESTLIRKVRITGIYHTGILEYDKKVILCQNNFLEKLGIQGIGGYEIFISPQTSKEQKSQLMKHFVALPLEWSGIAIEKLLPDLFDWINYAKSTEKLFLSILSLLILFNLAISFLLFVVDRSRMVGLLIALGYSRSMLSKIVFICGGIWSFLGSMAGLLMALVFLFTQEKWEWIKLSAEVHYLETAMIDIHPLEWMVVLLLMFVVSILSLLLPAWIASRFQPTKVLRFN